MQTLERKSKFFKNRDLGLYREPLYRYFGENRVSSLEAGELVKGFDEAVELGCLDGGDRTVSFSLGVVYARAARESMSPAVLLPEIVRVAQFARDFYGDSRSVNDIFLAMVERANGAEEGSA